MTDDKLIEQIKKDIVEAARILREGGYLTATMHGNISARIGDSNQIILTKRSHLGKELDVDQLAIVSLKDDRSIKELHPSSAEIVDMHRILYDEKKEVGAVIHTHSPFATGFAIASEEIPVAYEAMIRQGITKPIPVAEYGSRGSEKSINNIKKNVAGSKAVLLANHGVLAFDKNVLSAARVVVVIEEASMMYVNARSIGKIKPIPSDMISNTIDRKKKFSYSN